MHSKMLIANNKSANSDSNQFCQKEMGSSVKFATNYVYGHEQMTTSN